MKEVREDMVNWKHHYTAWGVCLFILGLMIAFVLILTGGEKVAHVLYGELGIIAPQSSLFQSSNLGMSFLVSGIIFGVICAIIAALKKRNLWMWLGAGFWIQIIGLIIVALLPKKVKFQ
jgi:hypothetical protein